MRKFNSTQAAEFLAITQAWQVANGKVPSIYSDSRYAFRVVHDFGMVWKWKGF